MANATEASRSYRLELEPQKRSIFVTQLGERGEDDREEEDVNKYPIVKESAGKLIETGLNTMQKTLLLKREVEVDKVTLELQAKRENFQQRMEECEKKRIELQKKQQRMKDRVSKFDKFIQETEAKRRRAIHKYQTELKLKDQKQSEYELLLQQLEELKLVHKELCTKLQKHKKYEDYLMRVLDDIPENYLEVNDSMLRSLMDRHRTLSTTNQALIARVQNMSDQIDTDNQRMEELKYSHDQKKLLINRQLAELQSKQEEVMEANAQLEEEIFSELNSYRDHSEILGRIQMAVNDIADKCHKKHDPALDSMTYIEKLQLIMLFTMDLISVEKMARSMSLGSRTRRKSKSSFSATGSKGSRNNTSMGSNSQKR
ncbi:coiled-coil domain-containing protein 42 like-2-like [Acanthaster planci]|uniref:Coiled-coil domain-containing protein 42 like-2-like n=1 Tax=Acanthaster planci TaxID=133434 RepID=A0A8B7YTR2_ACAPL|nr:coiled-coil domain-containing protein 42 like-2-like [Acanthaster planci]